MSDQPSPAYRYWAFISYSSKDAAQAKWLHRAIETYGIPAKMVPHGHATPVGEPAPKRFQPVFRDRAELSASADLGQTIGAALAASRYLIVICSPNAAQSRWVNREIETFTALGRGDRIFACIVDGKPNSGDEHECFPPALRQREPLAADARRQADGKNDARLKLLAGMLGLGFDALKQRDAQRRIRLLQEVIAVVALLVLAFAGLAWYANLERQRAVVAEGNAVTESHVRATAEANAVSEAHSRATAEANAVSEAHARATAQVVAEEQRNEAQRQARLALAGKLAAQSQLLFKDQLDLALLLSVEASNTADTAEAQLSPRLALEYSPRLRHILKAGAAAARPFAISPDGSTLALGECAATMDTNIGKRCSQGRVVFLAAATGRPTGKSLDLGAFSAGALAYSGDGKTLIMVGYSAIAVWDIEKDSLVGEYPTGQKETRFYPTAAAFSPDGRLLAIGSCGDRSKGGDANGYCNMGEVRLWDIGKRQLYGPPISAHETDVGALAFSPDGRLLASCGDATIKLWGIPDSAGAAEIALAAEPIQPSDTVVAALAFSPDGKLLAAGGSGHSITLWDVASGLAQGSQLRGHAYWVSALQFSPDGKTLASGSWDDTLLLWDLASRQPLGRPLSGHAGDVRALSYSPDGQRLVSADRNGAVLLWDTGDRFTGSPLGQVLPPTSGTFVWTHAFSSDGKILAYGSGNTIYLWDMQNDRPIGEPLKGHKDDVRSLVFPPQDGGKTLVSASSNRAAITWDVTTGQPVQQTGQDPEAAISNAAFSRDGLTLAYASSQGSLMILTLPEGQRLQKLGLSSKNGRISRIAVNQNGSLAAAGVCETLGADQACTGWAIVVWDIVRDSLAGTPVTGLAGLPAAVALSPDGRLVAYNPKETDRIVLVDRFTGKALHEMISPPGLAPAASDLVFSPDGKILAAAYYMDARLNLWDTATGQPLGQPFLEQANIGKPVFSADGRILAWPLDGAPFLWDVTGQKPLGQPLRKGNALGSLAFSPDGSRIAIGGGLGNLENQAQVFDAASGQPIGQPLAGHVARITGLSFSAGGQQLFTISQEGTVDVWGLPEGVLEAQPVAGYLADRARVALSPEGRTLALTVCQIKPLRDCTESELWLQDTATGALTRQPALLPGSTGMVRYSHNGKLLAITLGRQVILWDVAAQRTLYTLENTQRDVDALAFSPDDGILAVKAEAVILWDLTTGTPLGDPIMDQTVSSAGDTLAGTEDWGVAFSPDGRTLATVGSLSGSLLLIETATGQPYGPALLDPRNQLMTGMLDSVSFSPDGKTLVSGNNSGRVFLWTINPTAWRKQACTTAGRNMTPDEWATYMPADQPYRKICP